ncbi:hypothetical protein HanIR_Chr12g0600931 [Helianthus annuus]|nr:hypothetical protein HanIR_Chr12g0600931 [Helianthus annuus]
MSAKTGLSLLVSSKCLRISQRESKSADFKGVSDQELMLLLQND